MKLPQGWAAWLPRSPRRRVARHRAVDSIHRLVPGSEPRNASGAAAKAERI